MTSEAAADSLGPNVLVGCGAVVTGAGSGIGRAIALRLATLGATVVGVGRRSEPLAETVAMHEGPGAVLARTCDVRDPEAVEDAVGWAAGQAPLRILVNNAGGQFALPAAEMSNNGWRSVIELNLNAVFWCSRAAYPYLRQGGGSIVNLSLSGVDRGMRGIAHSVAARAGVLGLTRTLALEWAPDQIRVNCVGPGSVDTAALDNYAPAVVDGLLDTVPMRRLTRAADVAEVVAFLASPAGALITGQILHVDGGAHIGPGVDMI